MGVEGTSRSIPPGRILVLDDDRALLAMIAEALRTVGHEVDAVGTLEQARARVFARPYDVVLSDLVLEHGTGIDLLREIRDARLDCEVLIMTGHGGVDAAVEAMRLGAHNFLTKPPSLRRLEIDVDNALEKVRLVRRLTAPSSGRGTRFGGLIGASAVMQALFAELEQVAAVDSSVMLLGESGTGKDVAAQAIHEASARARGPFIAVHCGAIPDELLESELFGHVKGAFTNADRDRKGLFLAAHGGTLFLDELATAPHRVQVGLLRVLQERIVRPVGSESGAAIDVRVISATNADLEAEIAAGRFRQDLYYRLATVRMRLPPLRERREDIPLLVSELLKRLQAAGTPQKRLDARALGRLVAHDWPGNVRQLAHVLEQASILCRHPVVRAADLPLDGVSSGERIKTLEEVERDHIKRVLELCGGNKKLAAQALGLPRGSLYHRLDRYGIATPASEEPEQPSSLDAVPPVIAPEGTTPSTGGGAPHLPGRAIQP